MTHRITKRAQKDIDKIARFILKDRGENAAIRLFERFDKHFRMLSDHPYSGRLRQHDLGLGRRSITTMGYIVVYRVVARNAVILRVMDGRRDYSNLIRDE